MSTTPTSAGSPAVSTLGSPIEAGDFVSIGQSDLTWRVNGAPYKAVRAGRFIFGETLVVDLRSGQSDRWRHGVPVSTLTLFQKGNPQK